MTAAGRNFGSFWIAYVGALLSANEPRAATPNPHFSHSREKCAQGADPAAAGSGLATKAFAPAGRFPSGLPQVDFS
jgi:hypothetical protein